MSAAVVLHLILKPEPLRARVPLDQSQTAAPVAAH
jgi:hypothetical protein